MTKKQKRLLSIGALLLFASGAITLVLSALSSSITYFYVPSDLAALTASPSATIRLGGLVETGSVSYGSGQAANKSSVVRFNVTDGRHVIAVAYEGILPDLFREGQGVVVQGRLASDGVLIAENVLAKHDENYMPKELADALKETGRWQEGAVD